MVGDRVMWVPRKVEGWDYLDTVVNEFTTNGGEAFDDSDEWDRYLAWSEDMVFGIVASEEGGLIDIRLEELLCGRTMVTYPAELFRSCSFEVLP